MNCKHIFFLLIALNYFPELSGQQIKIDPVAGGYNIWANIPSHPAILGRAPLIVSSGSSTAVEPSWTPSHGNAGTLILLEFGDGTFTFSNSETHNYNNTVHKYGVLMKTTGVYDPDKRPPRATIETASTFSTLYNSRSATTVFPVTSYATASMPSAVITNLAKVLVQPNINSLVADDTMIFILTYKLDSLDIGRIINFNYNNSDFFIPLKGGEEIVDVGNSVPFIRFFQNELISYQNEGKEYLNNIVIENLAKDGQEHNIFITLVPRPDLRMEDLPQTKENKNTEVLDENKLTANIQADLLDKDGNVLETSKNELEVMDDSHDPNYIRILPKCLPFPKKEIKELRFHAHCQNIGLGDAVTVKMSIALPYGLKPSDIYDTKVKLPQGVAASWAVGTLDSLVYTFYRASDKSLNGIKNNPLWLNDPNTMGDVWFKLKTNSSVNNVLETQASIVFSNRDSSVNDPVLTNIDRTAFSACCSCKSKTEKCGCDKKKSKIWKWLFCRRC